MHKAANGVACSCNGVVACGTHSGRLNFENVSEELAALLSNGLVHGEVDEWGRAVGEEPIELSDKN